MPQPLEVEKFGLDGDCKRYSCLTCRQRKVKCDRRTPCCSNCVKAEKQCSFIPPVRGKRKRTKPPREGLHAKLKRYEELLKSYGANVEPSEDFDDSASEMASQLDIESECAELQRKSLSEAFRLEETKPKFIAKEGRSRYFDSGPWSNLGNELEHPEEGGLPESVDVLDIHAGELFFEPDHSCKYENLASLHPSSSVLLKLKDIYADRVDPLIKILHLPTFWITLKNGIEHPQDLSKDLEALVFAFYFAATTAMGEDECQHLFGAPQPAIYSRYKRATHHALVNAGFMSTSSLLTLRAYTLFVTCVRNSYRCDTLFILSGVAIRIARRMGLHRDGTSLGLSPFETEMRRRLWWNLVFVDFRTADVLAIRPSQDLFCSDTKIPLNVHDKDLHPDMVEQPLEHNGITSIGLCIIKSEIIDTIRKFSTICPGDVCWDILSNTDITPAKKDSIINQIQDRLEMKYLRYCDLTNSLHSFILFSSRAAVCRMRVLAHSPRQYANGLAKVPQTERNKVFQNAIKLLEYVILIKGGSYGLDKYLWLMGTSHVWIIMLYVLIEARHRKTGPEVDKSWQLISVVFSQYPQVFEESSGPVFMALGKWTLEAWDSCVAASQAEGLPQPLTPEYINEIRRCRRESEAKNIVPNSEAATRYPAGCKGPYDLEYSSSYDFSDLLSFEMDPNEWIQWEQLVTEQGSV